VHETEKFDEIFRFYCIFLILLAQNVSFVMFFVQSLKFFTFSLFHFFTLTFMFLTSAYKEIKNKENN